MDWQIRIALIIVGIGVIVFIFYDFNRRKKTQAEKQRLIDQMRMGIEQVDPQGFDMNGVSSARKASVDNPIEAGELDINASSDIGTSSDISTSTGAGTSFPGSGLTDTALNSEGSDTLTGGSGKVFPDDQAGKVKTSPTEQLSLVDEAIELEQGNPGDSNNQNNQKPEAGEPDLVISLILRASQNAKYKGKDFMPLLLSQGLRHGDMNIFHRYSSSKGKPGIVSYSVANAIQPGTFEIHDIENFETPAFAFFMALPGPGDPVGAFEGMVKTIFLLKQELGGQILDQTKSVFTQQTHQHLLDSLRDYLTKATLPK